MPYKSRPFDYEPVTRDGKKVRPGRELQEEFTARRVSQREEEVSEGRPLRPPQARATVPQADESLLLPSGEISSGTVKINEKEKAAEKGGRWILKNGHALSFLGLFLFTLVVFFRPYDLSPSLLFLRTSAFWIAVATLLIFVPTQLGLEGKLTLRPREVNLILLFCLIGLLGVPFAINRAEAWDEAFQFLKVVVMFVIMVNVIRTENRLKALMFIALAAGCMLSVGVINDYRQGLLLVGGERVRGMIGGMFINPNDMALYLVTVIPLAVTMLLIARGLTKKIFFGACALLLIAGTLVTFSRGGFFGLVTVLAVLAWKIGRRHRLTVLACSLVVGGLLLFLLPGGLVERFAAMFGMASNESAAGSAFSRWELLIRSLAQTVRHPILGVGMGNFHIVSIHEQVSHNAYTQVSSEMGVIALILYVMFMVVPLRRLSRIERETRRARHESNFYYLSVGLQVSIIGYMVNSFFVSVAYLYYIYYPVGFAVCLYFIYESAKAKEAVARRGDAGVRGRVDGEIESGVQERPVLEPAGV